MTEKMGFWRWLAKGTVGWLHRNWRDYLIAGVCVSSLILTQILFGDLAWVSLVIAWLVFIVAWILNTSYREYLEDP